MGGENDARLKPVKWQQKYRQFTLTVRFYGEFGKTCKNEKKHNYVDVSI
jgi:hypothetical protein